MITAALILAFLGWSVADGWSRVSDFHWDIDPALLAAGIVAVLVYYLAFGLGYVWIVTRLGGSPSSRLALLSVWGKSLLARYVPGTVLMLTGRVVLGRELGVPGRVSLAASVYEQTLLLTTAAVASLAFLAGYEGAGGGASWILVAASVAAGLGVLHPRVFRPLSTWALTKVGRDPLAVCLEERQLAGLFVYYGAVNALVAAGAWLLVRASAGPEAGDLGYVGLAFLLSFVLGMLAFPVPSGLGVRDAAFALALGRNLPGSVAVAVSAGVRLVLTAVELAFVAAVVAAARARGGRRVRRGVPEGASPP